MSRGITQYPGTKKDISGSILHSTKTGGEDMPYSTAVPEQNERACIPSSTAISEREREEYAHPVAHGTGTGKKGEYMLVKQILALQGNGCVDAGD